MELSCPASASTAVAVASSMSKSASSSTSSDSLSAATFQKPETARFLMNLWELEGYAFFGVGQQTVTEPGVPSLTVRSPIDQLGALDELRDLMRPDVSRTTSETQASVFVASSSALLKRLLVLFRNISWRYLRS
jgi:hypothetical protein